MQCIDGSTSVSIAIGIMSESSHLRIRNAIRQTWFQSLNSFPHINACFLLGMYVKRTPRASWDSRKKKNGRRVNGVLNLNPWLPDLHLEQRTHRDSVILPHSAEIDCFGSGTSGLKTLPWWKYSVDRFPNARWVAKTDEDIYVHIPSVAPVFDQLRVPDHHALLGTIRRGICYSPVRYQFEFVKSGKCPSSSFSQTVYPGDESDPAATYEGLFPFALGWFYAVSASLARSLARCEYAHDFHNVALNRRVDHFMRRGDDPMNGFLIHKCSNRSLHTISMDPPAIHNLGCYSKKGLYRIIHRKSKIVHAVKSAKAMGFVHKTMLSTSRELINATSCAAARSAKRSE